MLGHLVNTFVRSGRSLSRASAFWLFVWWQRPGGLFPKREALAGLLDLVEESHLCVCSTRLVSKCAQVGKIWNQHLGAIADGR